MHKGRSHMKRYNEIKWMISLVGSKVSRDELLKQPTSPKDAPLKKKLSIMRRDLRRQPICKTKECSQNISRFFIEFYQEQPTITHNHTYWLITDAIIHHHMRGFWNPSFFLKVENLTRKAIKHNRRQRREGWEQLPRKHMHAPLDQVFFAMHTSN